MLTGVRLDRLYGIEMTKTIGVGGSFGVHQDHEGTYQFRQGSMRNALVVVAWNLTDSGGDNGGVSYSCPCAASPPRRYLFLTACAVCVRQFFVFPGSHKANWPLPASAAAKTRTIAPTATLHVYRGCAQNKLWSAVFTVLSTPLG